VGWKFNGPCLLLTYADDVNLLADNIDTIKKTISTLIKVSMGDSLEINVEKTKHMLLSHCQNAGQNHEVKVANRSFANMSNLSIWE
jgi:hypothetical protein